jgi:hypothetical protein
MNGEINFEPQLSSESVSPDEVRKMLAEILEKSSDDMLTEVTERISIIKDQLLNTYSWSDRRVSPYWHALAGSTMKDDEITVVNPVTQRHIAETVIGTVRRLRTSFEIPESALESSQTLIREIALFRERLNDYPNQQVDFTNSMYDHIRLLQKQYPDERLTQIPEIQYLISGSEVVTDDGISLQTISEVSLSVTEKYLEVKERIEKELTLGSEVHS